MIWILGFFLIRILLDLRAAFPSFFGFRFVSRVERREEAKRKQRWVWSGFSSDEEVTLISWTSACHLLTWFPRAQNLVLNIHRAAKDKGRTRLIKPPSLLASITGRLLPLRSPIRNGGRERGLRLPFLFLPSLLPPLVFFLPQINLRLPQTASFRPSVAQQRPFQSAEKRRGRLHNWNLLDLYAHSVVCASRGLVY